MGLFRLYLAICVVAAHSNNFFVLPLPGGREAVQIFFIISGFYMQFILSTKYKNIKDFYISRFLRLFVPYYSILALVILASLLNGYLTSNYLSLQKSLNIGGAFSSAAFFALLTNLTIIFQDWVMFLTSNSQGSLSFTANFSSSPLQLWEYLWIPPAFTLGIELAFYLLVPFLVRYFSTYKLIALGFVLFAIRLFVYDRFNLAIDPWLYRFFPFELLHFIYGMLSAKILLSQQSFFRALSNKVNSVCINRTFTFHLIFYALLLAFIILEFQLMSFLRNYSFELIRGGWEIAYLLSLAVWIPVLPVLFAISRNSKLDRFLGELSYPVYLLHYTIVLIVAQFFVDKTSHAGLYGITCVILSLLVAIGLQFLFLIPFEKWRQKKFISFAKQTD